MRGPITVMGQTVHLPSLTTSKPKYEFSREWYKADFYYDDFESITAWCIQQFGPHPVNPDAWSRWKHNGQDRVFFRDEKDYILFLLKWS